MIVAPLANPVACSDRHNLLQLLVRRLGLLGLTGDQVAGRLELLVLSTNKLDIRVTRSRLLPGLPLPLGLISLDQATLVLGLEYVTGLANLVRGSLRLLAPIAVLSPLEVVVVAFRALPPSLRELERIL